MTSWLSPDRQPAAPGVSQGGGQKVGQQGRSQQGGGQQGGGGKGGAQQGGGRFPAGFAAPRSGVVGRGEAVAAHTLQGGRAKEEGEGAVVKGPMQVRVSFHLIIVNHCMFLYACGSQQQGCHYNTFYSVLVEDPRIFGILLS